MAPKISLLNVSPDACLLEREHAAQKFIIATDAVFLKAQGLATLAPLHKMAFGLLKGLLDDWHLLNLTQPIMNLFLILPTFLERQGKLSQFFVLEGYKGKGKAKALLEDSEPTGAKRSFKSRELVDSNSDEEEEEDRVHVIKKIKHEHVEELTGAKRRKEIMELDDEVEIVASKIPVAGPLHPTSKPIVLVPGASKFIPKLIVTLASPVAGPSTAPIASSSPPKP
ncbi:hypothetical protein C0995_000327, partial [Termitomyces sp. Mi166